MPRLRDYLVRKYRAEKKKPRETNDEATVCEKPIRRIKGGRRTCRRGEARLDLVVVCGNALAEMDDDSPSNNTVRSNGLLSILTTDKALKSVGMTTSKSINRNRLKKLICVKVLKSSQPDKDGDIKETPK